MSIYWIIFFIIVFLWVSMEATFAIRGGKRSQQDKSLWLIWVFNLLAISIGNILRSASFAHIWINPRLFPVLGTIIILMGLQSESGQSEHLVSFLNRPL